MSGPARKDFRGRRASVTFRDEEEKNQILGELRRRKGEVPGPHPHPHPNRPVGPSDSDLVIEVLRKAIGKSLPAAP